MSSSSITNYLLLSEYPFGHYVAYVFELLRNWFIFN